MAPLVTKSAQRYLFAIIVACLCLFPATPPGHEIPHPDHAGSYLSAYSGAFHFVSHRPPISIKFLDLRLQIVYMPDLDRELPDTLGVRSAAFLLVVQLLLTLLLLMPLKYGSIFVNTLLDGKTTIPERRYAEHEKRRASIQTDRPHGKVFEDFFPVHRARGRWAFGSQILL